VGREASEAVFASPVDVVAQTKDAGRPDGDRQMPFAATWLTLA
jgi:hypothetical protein